MTEQNINRTEENIPKTNTNIQSEVKCDTNELCDLSIDVSNL